ncbi:PREDICTED: left-right determination factor 2 isoform X1 [Galeopterus variegatus]|uniref:Left-right determination factor n=1 Tax=Galeopterus variegatus TaxID=482537 RepID=A0ABM0RPM8_GALVR|nr:PREDICTED: left-right determination factor 2 isoform X1 [Galeopterus variegatus]
MLLCFTFLPSSSMWPLWLCWALWALSLAGPGTALTEGQVLGSLLQQLHLSQAPVLDKSDVGELAIPAHVRAQYVALLQRSHGDRSRGKRFSQNFREVASRFLVSEADTHLLVFSMEQRLPPNSELVQAVLRLFQEPVPKAALRRHEGLSPRSAQARVTVEWLRVRDDGSNRTSLIDSRLVSLHDSGWKAFDVTEAVNFWQQLSRPRQPLLLQVSVQREQLGPRASGAHRLVRFAAQGAPGAGHGEPQLELHTLDLTRYGAQGNCDPEAPVTEGTRCCRQETYIDLQGLEWAQNWVLEPPGFLAYECVGSCLQPPEPLTFKWPFLGPRQCIASEMASLPVIVSVKEGGRTRARVVSLPDMRVQKCSCASDGALVPRRLEP